MAERREEEEGEEGARLWSSGGLYRPRSSWVRNVVTGGGRFGPRRLGGERAEEAAALRRPGVSWRLGKGSGTRVRARRCQGAGQVALRGFPGSIWPRARGGLSPPAAYGGRRKNRAPGEREVKVRAYLGFLKFQGPFGKQKFSPTWRAQMEKC